MIIEQVQVGNFAVFAYVVGCEETGEGIVIDPADQVGHLLDIAESRLEVDKSEELINALATQQRFALQACYSIFKKGTTKVSTGQAYEVYKSICSAERCRPLTQRRFCDIISFLDLYGLINARVVSMGRYGKTREIMSSLPDQVVKGFL